jgi:hypothetical protein
VPGVDAASGAARRYQYRNIPLITDAARNAITTQIVMVTHTG